MMSACDLTSVTLLLHSLNVQTSPVISDIILDTMCARHEYGIHMFDIPALLVDNTTCVVCCKTRMCGELFVLNCVHNFVNIVLVLTDCIFVNINLMIVLQCLEK